MSVDITKEQMHAALPQVKADDLDKFYEPLIDAMEEFEINTGKRMAAFLAQCAHESGNLHVLHENLNYKAEGLVKIFHKYFPDIDTANEYAHNPEKIANRVYSNRMGNGDEASGDGYRYCGRGLIQLTGKTNYEACGEALEVDLDANPGYLETPEGAARSAAWFWWSRDLSELADNGDIKEITRRINGGFIGLEERIAHYNTALAALGE
jgi:putative chitinase